MAVQSFKELIVWQRSMDLAREVYRIGKRLPSDERFGLISQMQRCSVSIPSNIAEGSKRATSKDFTQFLRIALGSSCELETQLLLAHDVHGIEIETALPQLTEVQKMLEGLIRRLRK